VRNQFTQSPTAMRARQALAVLGYGVQVDTFLVLWLGTFLRLVVTFANAPPGAFLKHAPPLTSISSLSLQSPTQKCEDVNLQGGSPWIEKSEYLWRTARN